MNSKKFDDALDLLPWQQEVVRQLLNLENTMTREKMLKLQSVRKNPIVRVHACACGRGGTPQSPAATWPLRNRGTRSKPDYRCTGCGRSV